MSRRTAWWAVLVALLLSGAVLGLLGEGERAQRPTDSLPSGLDSTEAVQLEEELGQSSARVAVVLFTTEDGTIDAGLRRQVERLATRVGAPPGTVQVAEDRTAAVAVVPVDAGSATETIDLVGELRDRLDAAAPDGVTAQVTGPAGIEADLAQVFDGADTRLLMITAGVVALLLVLTYRSPVLWLVPLLVVGVADRVASILATQALAALDVAWDESTIGILSVLVFGAGTDYALLLISRYRDELRSHASRHAAMARAWRRTLEPVLASSVTVTVGLLTLLLSLTPTTRGLGLACAIGVLVAAAYVLLVLPCALVLCGRWVFWPRVPREGDTALVDGRSLWRRVGDAVARRPAALATSTLALLALLSVGLLRVDVGLSQSEQFLDEPEAISAAERLAESFPAGAANPTTVVTRADPQRVVALVTDSPGVADARVTGEGKEVARIDVVLDEASGSAGSREAIAELRAAVAGLEDTHVGGDEAAELDEREGAARDRLLIWPLILVLVLGALVLLLRSVLAPVLLVATVVATYAASMGASWWLFTGPLGFSALDSQVPLFAFLFLVALGVDYNIFLVTRAREEARGHGTRSGMLRALAATGGVITSAGILLAAVFAVLGVLPLVVLAQLGLIICLGVLLDTLLVRTVLVPALALLLGERFWWPGRPSASAG